MRAASSLGNEPQVLMISPNDALIARSPRSYDYVLANPPFGKKSSMSFTNEEGEEEEEIAGEIVENLEAALSSFRTVLTALRTAPQARPPSDS